MIVAVICTKEATGAPHPPPMAAARGLLAPDIAAASR
jgi:hypothetical protein